MKRCGHPVGARDYADPWTFGRVWGERLCRSPGGGGGNDLKAHEGSFVLARSPASLLN